jgi:xanthine dehydrogenase YagS FAD-binding subunit
MSAHLDVRSGWPVISQALEASASPQVRNMGTIGGAPHASDLAVALTAIDATLELRGIDGERRMPVAEFYRLPGNTPHVETVLQPGEMIIGVLVPTSKMARASIYLKLRDRASFEFALVSVAIGLDLRDGVV